MIDSTCPAVYAALQAGQKGLPFIPLRGLLGTDLLARRDDWKVIDNPFAPGDPIVVLKAIRPDFALFHASLADRFGNVFIGRERELLIMAHAAHRTLVTVEADHRPESARGHGARRRGHPVDLCGQRRPGAARRVAGRSGRPLSAGRDGACALHRGSAHAGRFRELPESVARGAQGRSLMGVSATELLVAVIARLLAGCRHVAVGTVLADSRLGGSARPPPFRRRDAGERAGLAAQQLLHQRRRRAVRPRRAGPHRCVLSGRRPDRWTGQHQPGRRQRRWHSEVRWPGSFGSAYLYFLVPRVILFREEHTRRVMVPRVDFVSAPGVSAAAAYRPGGPCALLTGLGLVPVRQGAQRFRLESVHPGHTVEEILDNTGFEFDRSERSRTHRCRKRACSR